MKRGIVHSLGLPAPTTGDNHPVPLRKGILSPALQFITGELQREIGFLLERTNRTILSTAEVDSSLKKVLERSGLAITDFERDAVLAHIERESKPFGVLQDLVDDESVSDIIVSDYSHVAVQQGRRNYKTDRMFLNQEAYESFVEKLLLTAGSTYSTKVPIADGMIGDYARVHAVHKSICDTGPYLTIRLNRFSTVTIESLLKTAIAPTEVIHYLRAIILSGCTSLIVGEVGTGKTTLARALAGSIPTDESIIVIEDTPEIRLEHPHVRYLTTRHANTDGAGRITPSECIRAGMRMAMNRIIFGEIRDAEAAESFVDVCASGHPGLSTIHARSASDAVSRLVLFLGRKQKGVETKILTEQIATAVQVIVHIDICKVTGKRRIMEVKEIGPVADGVLRQRDMFQYCYHDGAPTWKLLNKISGYRTRIEDLGDYSVKLSEFPNLIRLAQEIQYQEVIKERHVA